MDTRSLASSNTKPRPTSASANVIVPCRAPSCAPSRSDAVSSPGHHETIPGGTGAHPGIEGIVLLVVDVGEVVEVVEGVPALNGPAATSLKSTRRSSLVVDRKCSASLACVSFLLRCTVALKAPDDMTSMVRLHALLASWATAWPR